jgi:hypothetical protein
MTDLTEIDIDANYVVERLEAAGRCLLAMRLSKPGPGNLRTGGLDFVREAVEAYGWQDSKVRPAIPSPAEITAMDEALAWLSLIPQDRYVLRRIVGARCLMDPMRNRHVFTWRRLAVMIGADHKAVQAWHARGIAAIVTALRRGSRPVGDADIPKGW